MESSCAGYGWPYDVSVTTFRSAVEALPTKGPDAVGPAIAGGAPEASPEDLARLTEVLAGSGASIGKPLAERIDVASTGGPGSLTTLLAPLAAVACGARISKIAVPGRPAGGIDTLGSIPGFLTDLDLKKARAVLESCGYLHTMAGRYFCPLDAAFFAWRRPARLICSTNWPAIPATLCARESRAARIVRPNSSLNSPLTPSSWYANRWPVAQIARPTCSPNSSAIPSRSCE